MDSLEPGFDITNTYKYTVKKDDKNVPEEIKGYVIGDAINYE
jgi:hypothetical protein|nr:MAG TPA: nucleoprotein [Bacteriophage sp.]